MIKKISCHTQREGVALFYEDGTRTFLPFSRIDNSHQVYAKPFPLKGKKPSYEQDRFTSEQNKYYRLAVYGLGAIPREELNTLNPNQLRAARRTFIKAQAEINRMKNEKLDADFFHIMTKIFKGKSSKVIQALKGEYSDQHDEVYNTLPLSFLGITKEMVAKRLIEAKILNPRIFNF